MRSPIRYGDTLEHGGEVASASPFSIFKLRYGCGLPRCYRTAFSQYERTCGSFDIVCKCVGRASGHSHI
jgi:hypothetical protein